MACRRPALSLIASQLRERRFRFRRFREIVARSKRPLKILPRGVALPGTKLSQTKMGLKHGVLVSSLQPGGPAEKAGLVPADVIARIPLHQGERFGFFLDVGTHVDATVAQTAVTAAKVKDTVVKDGYWKASEICTGPYAAACKKYGIQ